jgi:hypothetical protein
MGPFFLQAAFPKTSPFSAIFNHLQKNFVGCIFDLNRPDLTGFPFSNQSHP